MKCGGCGCSLNEDEMITHATLYSLANSLGVLAMFTVVAYHFVAVNAKRIGETAAKAS